jgi:type II secretory pathway pseudopilin PulG
MSMKRSSRKSLTLVELLIAVTIVGFALSAILALYVSCFGLTTVSRNVSIATDTAQALLEQIRSTTHADIFSTYDGLEFAVTNIPNSRGVVYVDDTDPELLKVTISVCWRQGGIVIGEDTNLDGDLDAGEDKPPYNNMIDSPVELVTQIVNR